MQGRGTIRVRREGDGEGRNECGPKAAFSARGSKLTTSGHKSKLVY